MAWTGMHAFTPSQLGYGIAAVRLVDIGFAGMYAYQLMIKDVTALRQVPVCLSSCDLSIHNRLWRVQPLPDFSLKSLAEGSTGLSHVMAMP